MKCSYLKRREDKEIVQILHVCPRCNRVELNTPAIPNYIEQLPNIGENLR